MAGVTIIKNLYKTLCGRGPVKNLWRAGCGPRAVVWRPLLYTVWSFCSIVISIPVKNKIALA